MRIDYSEVGFQNVVFHEPKPVPKAPTGGVGTELLNHRLMRMVKWFLGDKCDCRKKAAEWDTAGIDWCEAHVDDQLIPHLRATAGRFHLPWSEREAKRLIRVAIVRAKRKALAPRL